MTCDDCPNQTDGKCCHQSIRTQGSKTMNLSDDRANDEADRHAQMMQAQRETKQVEQKSGHFSLCETPFRWEKTGTEYEK